jgi:hypothetical protein
MGPNNQMVPTVEITAHQWSKIYNWCKKCRRQVDRERKASFDGFILHFWWNIWKKRNRRTFQQVVKLPLDVAYLIKEDIQLLQSAKRTELHAE